MYERTPDGFHPGELRIYGFVLIDSTIISTPKTCPYTWCHLSSQFWHKTHRPSLSKSIIANRFSLAFPPLRCHQKWSSSGLCLFAMQWMEALLAPITLCYCYQVTTPFRVALPCIFKAFLSNLQFLSFSETLHGKSLESLSQSMVDSGEILSAELYG